MPRTTILALFLLAPLTAGARAPQNVTPPPEQGALAIPLGDVAWWKRGPDGAPTIEGMRGKVFLIQTYAFFCDT